MQTPTFTSGNDVQAPKSRQEQMAELERQFDVAKRHAQVLRAWVPPTSYEE